MNCLAIFGIESPAEILLIIFIFVLLFGGKKLPELARALGKSINEFKRGQTESEPEKKIEKQAEPADPDEPDSTASKK
ncbi:MAG TPA: twin-arginine translocase TatA/TatE family subunit [Pontiellaceae bacterium]|mgnify:CR=1 FL=1|nr:twin-arginine translocase TatA/TatE family subunit [Pontiellaceae bacterium]HPR82831.1 twin-arginine translocase TatA/TatE family subunit [Pontiellaceae bacterium]